MLFFPLETQLLNIDSGVSHNNWMQATVAFFGIGTWRHGRGNSCCIPGFLLYSDMKIISYLTVVVFTILLHCFDVIVAQTYTTWHESLYFDLVAAGNLQQRLKGRAPDHHESCTPHIWSSLVTESLIQHATWNNIHCKGKAIAVHVLVMFLHREVPIFH